MDNSALYNSGAEDWLLGRLNRSFGVTVSQMGRPPNLLHGTLRFCFLCTLPL